MSAARRLRPWRSSARSTRLGCLMHPIRLRGARTHNLQGIDLELRPGELVGDHRRLAAPANRRSRSTRSTPRASGASSRASARTRGSSSSGSSGRRWTRSSRCAAGVAVDRRAPVKSSRSTVATMADLEPYLSRSSRARPCAVCPDHGVEAVSHRSRRARLEAAAERARRRDGGRHVSASAWTAPRRTSTRARRSRATAIAACSCAARRATSTSVEAERGRLGGGGDRGRRRSGRSRQRRPTPARRSHRGGVAAQPTASRALRRATAERRPTPRRRASVSPRARVPGVRARASQRREPGLFSYQSPVGACPHVPRLRAHDRRRLRQGDPRRDATLAQGRDPPVGRQRRRSGNAASLEKFCEADGIPIDEPWRDAHRASSGGRARGRRHAGTSGKFPGVLGVVQVARDADVQDARARAPRALSLVRPVRRVRRQAPLARTRSSYRVGGIDLAAWHALEIRDARARLAALATQTGARRDGAARAREPARVPRARRPRLSDARSAGAHALGRRGAARDAHGGARHVAHRRALRARRADGRSAPDRRPAARSKRCASSPRAATSCSSSSTIRS